MEARYVFPPSSPKNVRFQNVLGGFLAYMVYTSVDVLVTQWYSLVMQGVDAITPKCLLNVGPLWITEELRVIEQLQEQMEESSCGIQPGSCKGSIKKIL